MHEESFDYDKWHQWRTKLKSAQDALAEYLLKHFNPSIALDIGCGDASLLYSFHKLRVKGYGIDISKRRFSYAPNDIRGNLILIDIEKGGLPFKDSTFDLVTIIEVLEHLYKHNNIISEMKRVLKHNGCIYISAPSRRADRLNRLMGFLQTGKRASFDYTPHVSLHNKNYYIRIFENNGFYFVKDLRKVINKEMSDVILPMGKIEIVINKIGGKRLMSVYRFLLSSNILLFKKLENQNETQIDAEK
jgi:SAM-dependent methyltransferase